ncbi:LytR/AlgR family response regulator transcription factor [Butyrivibrio sp. YAB3001]|uniref:LytR/AlgR family response regulator transcription factor n=1 Tax=Butyrivibrio sp. YAB3001 TaxID=1520812 RepID=UPI0008F65F5C|nr:LytTR family DNA-binding domain-containing protein [Butyrivibrio sp. YAB3001]SFC21229.1 two component transcriptional regulator, LytTR family [Butyrivibrio sp. YAB3001]
MSKTIIGVCDDQRVSALILQEQIASLKSELNGIHWEIRVFTSPFKMLEEVKDLSILFLDIEMPELDGIEAGERVRELNPSCKIILATSRIDRFKDGFRIHALRFITKPYDRDEIRDALCASLDMSVGEHTVEMFLNRVCYKVKEKDIKYIRAFNGYVEIIAGKGVYRKDTSLDALEETLDKRLFCRIHRQYLVNLKYVDSYKKDSVTIKNETLPISKRRQTDFMCQYTEYDLNYRLGG